ncbi:MAG: serine protease [Patescibacteria group bacterium]
MEQINWHNPLMKITPYIFKIKTPSVSGTGFQIFYSEKTNFLGIATADHVISHEDDWEEPIRIIHHQSGKSVLLKHNDRTITRYPEKDVAFILFKNKDLPIIPKPLDLIDKDEILQQGFEVGWCGFPSVAANDLCFFSGHISCHIPKEESYLVDGVAINGVSGGPVFYADKNGEPKFSGIISAYVPNRATGETLPGLCVMRSIGSYQHILQDLKSIEKKIVKKGTKKT